MIRISDNDVPALYSTWLPVALIIPLILVWNLDKPLYEAWFDSELGVIEMLTPIVLLIGIVFGSYALLKHDFYNVTGLKVWVVLIILACVYFAGEEISWGQHLFNWKTPEALKSLNDQGETNLHNMSSWFDQKPRLLLEIWVLIGGVIVPIRRSLNKEQQNKDSFFYWFWPSSACLTAALLVILVKLPERIYDLFEINIIEVGSRHSEVQELYFAIFLALYLTSIYYRSKADQ